MTALPILPVLAGGGSDFPLWRSYFRWVYGEDVPADASVDLNTFSWFYDEAPFDLPLEVPQYVERLEGLLEGQP